MFNQTTNNSTMGNEKQYIGKGRQKAGSEYIVLHLHLNELLSAEWPPEGEALKVVVAKLRRPDMFGRTHTVYVPVKDEYADLENQRLADKQEIECRNQE